MDIFGERETPLILYSRGAEGNRIKLSLTLTIDYKMIDYALQKIENVIRNVESGLNEGMINNRERSEKEIAIHEFTVDSSLNYHLFSQSASDSGLNLLLIQENSLLSL